MDFKSVKEFKDNFSKKYHGEVVPLLKKYETERQFIYFCIVTIWLTVLVLGAILCANVKNTDVLLIVCAIGIVCAWYLTGFLQKKFENKIKIEVMPQLMPAFGNFLWTNDATIDSYTIRDTTLFSRFDDKIDDDNFFGTYKGIEICIDESLLQYETRDSKGNRHTHTEFDGVFVTLNLPKKLNAHTIIRKRVLMMNKKVYEEIKLEDTEFMKKYFVDGSDQVECRYLLTTAFMERFKNLQKTFGGNSIQASFNGNQIFIAISTSKDLFSIANVTKPLNDTKQFTTLLEEFVAILSIVDELKLNQNIGL